MEGITKLTSAVFRRKYSHTAFIPHVFRFQHIKHFRENNIHVYYGYLQYKYISNRFFATISKKSQKETNKNNNNNIKSNSKNNLNVKNNIEDELNKKSTAAANRKAEMDKFKMKVSEKSQKFKLFALLTLKKYGKLGAFTYLGVYLVTLAGFTIASYNGFLSDDDIKKGLKLLHMEHIKCPDLDSKFGRFIVAYVACKMVEPIRLIATIIIVTILSRVASIRALTGVVAK